MKTQVNKWFRWGAAGAFGLMLTLNVMVGLDFDKDKMLPTLTLVELGNQANAQSESGDGSDCSSTNVGTNAYMLCDYKKGWFSTNCKAKVDYTCLLRGDQPDIPDIDPWP